MRLRFDVLDADDVRCERPLEVRDDAAFHLFRREPVVLPDDAHDRDIDVREDVHGHGRNGDAAQDRNQQGHDDERVGASKRESDDPHDLLPG